MTNKETVERNIGLTFDYVHYLIDNPSTLENLPKTFKIEFLEKDFHKTVNPDNSKSEDNSKKKFVRVSNTFDLAR